MQIETIENLVKKLISIPGISKKQAEKMANFFVLQDKEYIDELAQLIQDIKKNISYCEKCNFITDKNVCSICSKPNKDNILMVVDNVVNCQKLINMEFYNGSYYILPYLMNLNDQLASKKYEYEQLIDFIKKNNFGEVIIVLSPSLEGEMTTTHLLKLLEKNKIIATRAVIGMPMNSNLEYLDKFTIMQSIINRNKNK
ncbi:toprim domain-containing protein [Mycoplasma sp. Mirounga ES2805-ORL]|uniref:toprim domain-containing protein n=1 Tax=Mycoplasma sp. Mirounga ES2805-ORL TaxID=754514 RepID=UPI00197B206E|nr:toprim domain-containing protein [Mycoplasma sp. Mirounga ES2805-ORL]QSF13394.1 recombination protein RecR [Mycoplasma sp. Mirounga ES2805-ORL]